MVTMEIITSVTKTTDGYTPGKIIRPLTGKVLCCGNYHQELFFSLFPINTLIVLQQYMNSRHGHSDICVAAWENQSHGQNLRY
jgi:hypothetical protein